MNTKALVPILAFLVDGQVVENPNSDVLALESEIRQRLNTMETDADFTLVIEAENGRRFTHSVGESSESIEYRSASTSKLVTAAVVLWFVNAGHIELIARPQDYIDGWPNDGNLGAITLEHLLSFTSGLVDDPLCISLPAAVFDNCVLIIADQNRDSTVPGENFYYGPAHMQVAGAMVAHALELDSWSAVFDRFKRETGLFDVSDYRYPSPSNPRLAAGMQWRASEYMEFLDALYRRSLFDQQTLNMLTADRLQDAAIDYSPARSGWEEDWHYGLGIWIECRSALFDCHSATRFSSPGSYGAYPFWDDRHHYFGILAREGERATAANGIDVVRQIDDLLEQWSSLNQAE